MQGPHRKARLRGRRIAGATGRRYGSHLWERYFTEHALLRKKESSRKHDQWQWEKILKPCWEHRKAAQLSRGEVEKALADVARKRGKVTANRLLALVRKVFNHGIKVGLVKVNPAAGVEKYPEQERDRFVQPDELPRLFAALDAHPNQTFADFIRLSLFVGPSREPAGDALGGNRPGPGILAHPRHQGQ